MLGSTVKRAVLPVGVLDDGLEEVLELDLVGDRHLCLVVLMQLFCQVA